jgi:signal peptidase I
MAAFLVVFWLTFAPQQLEGPADYVVTHGISMQPKFHAGDLAIVRPADPYRVGDIVAYNSATLHTVVMHRIVAQEGDRFVFKGDNNSWLDPDKPTQHDLIGKLWVQVPQGGKWLSFIHAPTTIGVAVMVLLLAGTRLKRKRRRRRRRYGVSQPA